MELTCSTCGFRIKPFDIDEAAGTAHCPRCNRTRTIDLIRRNPYGDARGSEIDLERSPPGAWYHDDGVEVRVGAQMRTLGSFGIVVFLMVWTVIFFVLPIMYPGKKGSPAITSCVLLFAAPLALAIWIYVIIGLFGRVEVRLRGSDARVFTGIGPFGRTKRFRTDEVTHVREGDAGWSRGKGDSERRAVGIIVEGPQRTVFGSRLSDDRRWFVRRALERALGLGPPAAPNRRASAE